MAHLIAVMKNEIRLTWRRHSFWVIQAVWLLPLCLTLLSNLGSGPAEPAARHVSEQLTTALATWLLLLPLVAASALTRELGDTGESVWATPLDGAVHLCGVVAGLFLALLPAMAAHLAAQWLVGSLLVGPSAVLVWIYGPLLFVPSTLAALGALAVLALLARRVLVLLLLWVALWAALLQASMGFFGTLLSAALISPANLFFYNLQLSPSLGMGPTRPLVQGLALWFATLGMLVVLAASGLAILVDRRRAIKRTKVWAASAAGAALAAIVAFSLHASAAQAQAIPRSPADVQAEQWRVLEHEMEVTIDPTRDFMSGVSTLRLAPVTPSTSDRVVLRLGGGLELTSLRDDTGAALLWTREGDSIVLSPPEPATPVLSLRLAWEGTPLPPYNDYGERLGLHYPAFDTPQPARALLWNGTGYLFRDGDWYPWPWSSAPHQAEESRVSLTVTSGRALAAKPLREGRATWEGSLPGVLLVLPPALSTMVEGVTIHYGTWQGEKSVLAERLREIATLLPELARALGDPSSPTHVVSLPYLHDIVWSGDLLLVPEGTGWVRDELRPLLLSARSGDERQPEMEARALMTELARAWLAEHLTLPSGWIRVPSSRDGIIAVAGVPGEDEIVRLPGVPEDPEGRWIASIGSPLPFLPGASTPQSRPLVGSGQDLREVELPVLSEEDQLDLLALLIAIELADQATREADLAILLGPPSAADGSDRFIPFLTQALPFDFPVGQSAKTALIGALHDWVERVGRDEALMALGEAVRGHNGPFTLAPLLESMAARSGVAISYMEGQ